MKTSHRTEKPDLSQTTFSITRKYEGKKKVNISGKKNTFIPHPPKGPKRKDESANCGSYSQTQADRRKLEKINNPHLAQKDMIVFTAEATSM